MIVVMSERGRELGFFAALNLPADRVPLHWSVEVEPLHFFNSSKGLSDIAASTTAETIEFIQVDLLVRQFGEFLRLVPTDAQAKLLLCSRNFTPLVPLVRCGICGYDPREEAK